MSNSGDRTSDRAVNAVLARASGTSTQAGAADGDPDPPTVEQLRAAQRTWVDDRDAVCRDASRSLSVLR
jgi:uncharacterized protein YecT (DUF1311 family)